MRLTDEDCGIAATFVFTKLCNDFLDDLKMTEKYVWELAENNPITGTRLVKERDFKTRTELVFENKIKIKCPEHLHRFSINKIQTANLNY